jgi:hypothetical protein
LKHAALHGAHRYDEAIEAFKTMFSMLENSSDTQTQSTPRISHPPTLLTLWPDLRQQYISPSEVEGVIEETIKVQLDDAPHRLINTFTGRLCSREGQINAFRMSPEYKELLSSTMGHADLQVERIRDVVAMYFR